MKTLQAAQQDMPDTGYFRANVTSQRNSRPISGATVQISDINNQDDILEEITTDQNGQTETVSLGAPPLEYSMIPESNQPYSVYNIRVSAPGYEPVDVSGAEILSGEVAIQNVSLLPLDETEPDSEELFVIPPHTLYEEYPPKIPEEEIKDITQTGEIVLSRVVIPSGVRLLPEGNICPSGHCPFDFRYVPSSRLMVPPCQRMALPPSCKTFPVFR